MSLVDDMETLAGDNVIARWDVYVTVRDKLENIEQYENNVALLQGTGSYASILWVSAKLARAEARLDALECEIAAAGDPIAFRQRMSLRLGTRKLVRKWREELAWAKALRDGELAAFETWLGRLDRKDFDGPFWMDDEVNALRSFRQA